MECKNCDKVLQENDQYCHGCGAKIIRKRLTLKNLWYEFTEKFFNIENTLLRTYLDLFKKPEAVIGGYVSGLRKRYVNVFNYFAVAVTLSGIQLFILRKFYPEVMDVTALMTENTPEVYANFDWVYDYYSLLVLINLPVYALIAYLVFYTLKKYNYTEHFVSMTYMSSQFSITSSLIVTPLCVLGLNFYIIGSLANIFFIIYTAYSYKRLLNLSREGIILRTFLFFGILVTLLLIQGLIQVYFMIQSGDFQKMIDAEKAKRGLSYIASSFRNWTS